jgi:hypothetical protein
LAHVHNREKRHVDVLDVLSTFLCTYHLRKCRRLMDDYNV